MSLLRRIPWWLWVALAVVGYAGVQEVRIRALHTRLDDAKLGDVAKDRAKVTGDLQALDGQRKALDASIAGAQAEVSGLRRQLTALHSTFAQQEVERTRLMETGTVDDVVAVGRALGYHPVGGTRPR